MLPRALCRYICCLPLALALVGCASKEEDEAASGLNLAFIPKTSNNLVFKLGFDGAEFGARSLTRETGRAVDVEYLASPELDPVAEQGLVRQAIAARKDGLLISCLDDSLTAPIDEAVEAGIPVITYDSDCPDSKRLGFYSVQAEETGAKSADLLASAMGSGQKKVAILTGRAGADNLERRLVGFTDRLAAAYPDVTVVATVHCLETAESCGPAVENEIIDQYPDLDGFFTTGLWGLSAACRCSDSGLSCVCDDGQMPHWKAAAKAKLKTVAYDSLPFELMLVEQGYVSALIGQKYFGWGYDTVRLMHEQLTSGKVAGGFIDSGFDVVCPNNAQQMSANWDSANFSEPLSPACDL
ncbi:MAG TPA: substrate-binding domain-containing protein [Polyangiaceae bacterium]|nr:substrate-binding domain-containing protein [Polyangiaceae bacterium]